MFVFADVAVNFPISLLGTMPYILELFMATNVPLLSSASLYNHVVDNQFDHIWSLHQPPIMVTAPGPEARLIQINVSTSLCSVAPVCPLWKIEMICMQKQKCLKYVFAVLSDVFFLKKSANFITWYKV